MNSRRTIPEVGSPSFGPEPDRLRDGGEVLVVRVGQPWGQLVDRFAEMVRVRDYQFRQGFGRPTSLMASSSSQRRFACACSEGVNASTMD